MSKRLLEDKLARMLECADFLDTRLPANAEGLAGEEVLLAACERKLTLLVEYACDICSIVITEDGKAEAESYAAVFRQAIQIGFISPELQGGLNRLVHTRNQLVHAYETVLAEATHEHCQEAVSLGSNQKCLMKETQEILSLRRNALRVKMLQDNFWRRTF